MATHTLVNPVFWRSHRGTTGPEFRGLALSADAAAVAGAGEEPYIKETASQTYRIGDLVYLDTNGTVAIVTESTDTVDSPILGLAARAASGTTGAPAYVQVIHPDDEYLMQVFHATPASAVTAQTMLGVAGYPIIKDESGNDTYHIDLATTAESGDAALAKVRVVGFPDRAPDGTVNTIGDTYGWCIVKFLEFTIASDGSPFTRNLQG